jgi:hypothetical protein
VRSVRKAAQKASSRGSTNRGSDPLDPQKDALYAWEDSWLSWNLDALTLNECRVMVRTACRRMGVPYIVVLQHKGISEYDCIDGKIRLQSRGKRGRGGKNPSQVLHEVAHYVVFRRSGWRPQDHGPSFLGVYLWLLACAKVAPAIALEASARAAGLRWYPCSG